ncbi:hypothetical protein CDAR_615101 [Caerostris darwini]|uniref:Uncharacterized protein n=1 Tax=Caerostris darwini TaxID=1538125 RepID=A0AAV4U8Y1_9ARAC|nr:hypothetical protein CDAR_615101 [Caerostris darwini]
MKKKAVFQCLQKRIKKGRDRFFCSDIWSREEISCFDVSRSRGHSITGRASSGVQMCSVQGFARYLDMPVIIVHKILLNILHCYLYKKMHVWELLPVDWLVRHKFALELLACMEVNNE